MDAYAAMKITHSPSRISNYLLMGTPDMIAERVRLILEDALRHGTADSIVLNPIHPADVVKV